MIRVPLIKYELRIKSRYDIDTLIEGALQATDKEDIQASRCTTLPRNSCIMKCVSLRACKQLNIDIDLSMEIL